MAGTDSSSESEPSPITDRRPSLLQSFLPSTQSADLPRYLPLPIPLPVQTMAFPASNVPFPSPRIEEVATFPRIRTHGLETIPSIITAPRPSPLLSAAGKRNVTSNSRESRQDSVDDGVSPLSSVHGEKREGSEAETGVEQLDGPPRQTDGAYVGDTKKADQRGDDAKAAKKDPFLRKLALQNAIPPAKGESREGQAGLENAERNDTNDDEGQEAWYTPNEDVSKNYDNIDATELRRLE